jgi:hypothetical protein
MATFTRILLSGSVSGQVIALTQTATPGNLIHTAVTGSGAYDEIFLYATNVTAAPVTLTIEWGDVVIPGSHIVHTTTIPAYSLPIPVITGQTMNGGLVIRAFCSSAGAINISGLANRIS